MPAKRNFGRCTSSQLSAESPVTREIEERIHKQAETHTHTRLMALFLGLPG